MCLHCWRQWEVLICNIALVIQSLFCWIWKFSVFITVWWKKSRGNCLSMQSKCIRQTKTWAQVFWVAKALVLYSILLVWRKRKCYIGKALRYLINVKFLGSHWWFLYNCCNLEICIKGCHGLGMVLLSLLSPTEILQACAACTVSCHPSLLPWGGMVNWRHTM